MIEIKTMKERITTKEVLEFYKALVHLKRAETICRAFK